MLRQEEVLLDEDVGIALRGQLRHHAQQEEADDHPRATYPHVSLRLADGIQALESSREAFSLSSVVQFRRVNQDKEELVDGTFFLVNEDFSVFVDVVGALVFGFGALFAQN